MYEPEGRAIRFWLFQLRAFWWNSESWPAPLCLPWSYPRRGYPGHTWRCSSWNIPTKHFWHKPAASLSLADDRGEGVWEILEEQILLLNMHSKDPVEELAHLVVALVQGEHSRAVLAWRDQPNTDKAISNVWKFSINILQSKRPWDLEVQPKCLYGWVISPRPDLLARG